MAVEPVPDERAAVATLDGDRALVVSDYHAGIEAGLRSDGVELPSHASERRTRLLDLVSGESPDKLVLLGDLGHSIGDPGRAEREEMLELFEALPPDLPVTLAKGNHDGNVATVTDDVRQTVEVSPGHGVRLGTVGFAHGHTWPSPDVLSADIVCVGHEHPVVRLEDEVGGKRVEPVWLRGTLVADPFAAFHDCDVGVNADDDERELVVFPGFNRLSGGTWVNVDDQEFLAPFLPDGMADGDAYLLDGTRLGPYERV